MRYDLLEILACPVCRFDLEIAEVSQEREGRIEEGQLRCKGCNQTYPIHKSIPRLVKAVDDVVQTGKRFGYQWKLWSEGRFEDKTFTYGIQRRPHAEWLLEKLAISSDIRPGDRYIDAGCGAGHMTQLHADLMPEQRVVGLDMGAAALEYAASHAERRHNLDYVQGNILEPPFKPSSFRWGMSKGVLHHTPTTRGAFASFRRLIQDDGSLLIWIYPTSKEGPEWSILYFARDYIFFRQGHRLPSTVVRWLSTGLVAALLPLAELKLRFAGERMSGKFPWFQPQKMSLGQRFRSQVFFLNDTILPKYLFIHSIEEVSSWFREEAVELIYEEGGFYGGRVGVSAYTNGRHPTVEPAAVDGAR